VRGDEVGDAQGEFVDEPDGDEARLWRAWRAEGDAAAREALIALHLPFARTMAGKLYARRHTSDVDFDEYLQLARVGLIESVDRYDAAQGASFRTYAAHRIQGSVLSGLDALTERGRQQAFRRRIEQDRLQSLAAPSEAVGEDSFTRLASIAVGLALGFMLDDVGMYRAQEPAYADNSYAGVESRQLRPRLLELMAALPDRESRIIRHHYLQQVPFEEIAQSLGLTKGRVSQLHRRALGLLRETLRAEGGLDLAA
jgi:RNA polymerase sigma factor for flagellar operon FliA